MQKIEKQADDSAKINEGPNPVDLHAGARLRLRRTMLGISQEQLGKALGVTFQQVQKYERGANRISVSRLHQMAQILSVPVEYFFDAVRPVRSQTTQPGFSDNKQEPLEGAPSGISHHESADPEILQRRETLELVRAWYQITDVKQRRKIYELIKSLAD